MCEYECATQLRNSTYKNVSYMEDPTIDYYVELANK